MALVFMMFRAAWCVLPPAVAAYMHAMHCTKSQSLSPELLFQVGDPRTATIATDKLRRQFTGHRSEIVRTVADLKAGQETIIQQTTAQLHGIAEQIQELAAGTNAPGTARRQARPGDASHAGGRTVRSALRDAGTQALTEPQVAAVIEYGDKARGLTVCLVRCVPYRNVLRFHGFFCVVPRPAACLLTLVRKHAGSRGCTPNHKWPHH